MSDVLKKNTPMITNAAFVTCRFMLLILLLYVLIV